MPATTPRHARRDSATTPAPTVADETVDEVPVDEVPAEAPECNVPGCPAAPELRGLCPAHRQTHRGLLGPKRKPA